MHFLSLPYPKNAATTTTTTTIKKEERKEEGKKKEAEMSKSARAKEELTREMKKKIPKGPQPSLMPVFLRQMQVPCFLLSSSSFLRFNRADSDRSPRKPQTIRSARRS